MGAFGPEPGDRVLLIEDNALTRVVAVGILTDLGFQVDVATSDARVTELAESGQAYRAVLVDSQMPTIDAFDVARRWRLREHERSDAHTLIIAMADSVVPGDRERCLAAGMDDYISTPIHRDTVRASLSRWLGDAIDSHQIEELRRLRAPAGSGPLADMIESFLDEAPAAVADVADALNRRDAAALSSHANGLKGMANALGATSMTEMCSAMAAQGRAGDLDRADDTMRRLRVEFDRAADELRAIADRIARAG